MGDLRVARACRKSVEAFKVVGDQHSVLEYSKAHPPRVQGEWSAIYLQLNEAHALGTVGYRWDMGYTLARLVRLSIPKVEFVVLDAPWMPQGDIRGDEKALRVKEALGIPAGERLMEALGKRGEAVLCRETEDQWELVVPESLLRVLSIEEHCVLELRPNAYGATGQWRRLSSGNGEATSEGVEAPWTRFDEVEALRQVPPPSWIAETLASAQAGGMEPGLTSSSLSDDVATGSNARDCSEGGAEGDSESSTDSRHFIGEWDDEGVYVYQAFNGEIANWAVEHQRFGGPKFNPARMTWIKPSLAWMLYRAGYGFKDANQQAVLKVKLPHKAMGEILSRCQEGHGGGGTEGRVQWDPARSLLEARNGEPAKTEGRAIQIGMKNDLSKFYVSQTLSIQDVTEQAHLVHQLHSLPAESCTAEVKLALARGALPHERPYFPRCSVEVAKRLRLCLRP